MAYPQTRLRRLRSHPILRAMVREARLNPDQLILPLFVRHGRHVREPIASLPGHHQFSVDRLVREAAEAARVGVRAVLLFGIPAKKDARASESYAPSGIVQQALRALKDRRLPLAVITDVCLCGYMSHGHCGMVRRQGQRVTIDNDASLDLLARTAVSHAKAGAELVAPSDMMDGRVGAIRQALDQAGFTHLPIMSYAAKYASSFYGPFREAAESAPRFGDRTGYQMDPANAHEALREVALDLEEGADIVMVKPALAYLDVIYRVKRRFGCPVAAYHVSGEHAMVKAAAAKGWLDETKASMEILLAMRRAGADLIITYGAKEAAKFLQP
ncbi:MAG: porphobilinogen synthase [Candidatus Omnitrophica bacterium]|nr:porphobilinogen synthase [Candidatus Omnitrophota bacterium]